MIDKTLSEEIVEVMARGAYMVDPEEEEWRGPDHEPRTIPWEDLTDDIKNLRSVAQRAALAALEGKGYVVVPREPTEAMIEAADGGNDTDWFNEYTYKIMVYRALGFKYEWRTGTAYPLEPSAAAEPGVPTPPEQT